MSYSFSVTSHSRAKPAAVYDLLVHAQTGPSWSRIDTAEVDDPTAAQQVGDRRRFRVGRMVSTEPIVDLVIDRRFGYLVQNRFFRSYHGLVELAGTPQGTDITWSATFEPRPHLSGPFWRWYLARFIGRMAVGLADYAARHPADTAHP